MRFYEIIIGSKAFFSNFVNEQLSKIESERYDDDLYITNFLELVKLKDISRQQKRLDNNIADYLIISNTDYNGIVNAAHDRLGALIEELTYDNATIYVHNPPRVLLEFLHDQQQREVISLNTTKEEYSIKRDPTEFSINITKISDSIIGQNDAVNEISKSLWYLTSVNRKKPYVIMLYGNSSLGKTELVREIANYFFDGKVLEKHLSMFKNNNYSDYFFGEEPNRRSIGFDLLERDSNLIFLDELDKCPEFFYSAFYTLFDNSEFKDSTYDVDISGAIIILTSNFHNEDEMKQHLGLPIFYRIDKFIKFEDFSAKTIYDITMKEIRAKKTEYADKISEEEIYKSVSKNIGTKDENARTIKFKVQQVIEDLLFREVTNKTN